VRGFSRHPCQRHHPWDPMRCDYPAQAPLQGSPDRAARQENREEQTAENVGERGGVQAADKISPGEGSRRMR
jgi:hypothetical protein